MVAAARDACNTRQSQPVSVVVPTLLHINTGIKVLNNVFQSVQTYVYLYLLLGFTCTCTQALCCHVSSELCILAAYHKRRGA